jgi:hypothetical protein
MDVGAMTPFLWLLKNEKLMEFDERVFPGVECMAFFFSGQVECDQIYLEF